MTKKEEENVQFVKENLEHAAQDINISTDLADKAMKAVQKTMKAIQEVQKSSKSLPTNEIENATHFGRDQAFLKPAIGATASGTLPFSVPSALPQCPSASP